MIKTAYELFNEFLDNNSLEFFLTSNDKSCFVSRLINRFEAVYVTRDCRWEETDYPHHVVIHDYARLHELAAHEWDTLLAKAREALVNSMQQTSN